MILEDAIRVNNRMSNVLRMQNRLVEKYSYLDKVQRSLTFNSSSVIALTKSPFDTIFKERATFQRHLDSMRVFEKVYSNGLIDNRNQMSGVIEEITKRNNFVETFVRNSGLNTIQRQISLGDTFSLSALVNSSGILSASSFNDIASVVEDDDFNELLISYEEQHSYDEFDSQIIDCTDVDNSLSLYEQMNQMYRNAEKQHPAVLWVISGFIFNLIFFVLSQSTAQTIINHNSFVVNNNTYNNYEVNIKIDRNLEDYIIWQCRVIAKDRAMVYQSRTTKSKVNIILRQGEIVEVIEKDGEWCSIIYRDKEKAIYGYVKSKYLKVVKRAHN